MPRTSDLEQISLPCEVASIRMARVFVADRVRHMEHVVADGTRDDVVLVASELVANAVRYCTGHLNLCIERLAACVEIIVHDDSPVLPTVREVNVTAESGRGLAIVGALCSEWGVRPVAGAGKSVWGRVPAAGSELTLVRQRKQGQRVGFRSGAA